MENNENVIEFLSGERYVTVSFTNRTHISRIKKLYEQRKDEFKYLKENKDGSVCAKIPLKWIRINPGQNPDAPKRELSEEEKQKRIENLRKARLNKKKL